MHIWWPRPREPQWIITHTACSDSPHRCGGGRVVDGVHGLHLEEVVARAEAAELVEPAFERAVADGRGVGALQDAAVFAALQIPDHAVTLVDGKLRAAR